MSEPTNEIGKEPLPLDLSGRQLLEVFPFLMVLDRGLRLIGHGPRLSKVCKNLALGTPFTELFAVKRPRGPISLESFRRGAKSTFFLVSHTTQIRMRGQLLFDDDNQRLLFIGAPWFTELEELEKTELILSDFTIHDPIVDFLYLIRAQKIVSEDPRLRFAVENFGDSRSAEALRKRVTAQVRAALCSAASSASQSSRSRSNQAIAPVFAYAG